MPPDAENAILKRIRKVSPGDDTPSDEADPKAGPQETASPPAHKVDIAPTKPAEVPQADKRRMESIIGKPAPTPSNKP